MIKKHLKEAFILPGYLIACFSVLGHLGDKVDIEDWFEFSSKPLFRKNKRWVPISFSIAFWLLLIYLLAAWLFPLTLVKLFSFLGIPYPFIANDDPGPLSFWVFVVASFFFAGTLIKSSLKKKPEGYKKPDQRPPLSKEMKNFLLGIVLYILGFLIVIAGVEHKDFIIMLIGGLCWWYGADKMPDIWE
jgi:hypothetical protein